MPRLSDLLERFRRRSTPPGASGPAPGALDALSGPEGELAGVFAHIDRIDAEVAAIREAARERARSIAARADAEAAATVARMPDEVSQARAAAFAERREAGAVEVARIHDDARAEAVRVRARAEQVAPVLVSRIVADVRSAFAPEREGTHAR